MTWLEKGHLLHANLIEILTKTERSMNSLDILISVIVGFCLVRGIFRGIIKEITSIVGVFVGFYAAYTYYPIVADHLSFLITNKSHLNIVSFFITFSILFLIVGFVGIVFKYLLKIVK